MLKTLLILYVSGIPLALVFTLWSLRGLPRDEWVEVGTLGGVAAVALFVLLWPVFFAVCLYDVWSER